ncbi:hypothetical protein [Fibrobacter sp.]|uniref:hypothetical protein n=1 Tax=Fibrobacter sp. TaxID=35828 RepID=UPI00388EF2EB
MQKKFAFFLLAAVLAVNFSFAEELPDVMDVVIVDPADLPVLKIDEDNAVATFNGYSKQPLEITGKISITDKVRLNRSFAKRFSTVMLPFSTTLDKFDPSITFYRFSGMKFEDGEYQVQMTAVEDKIEANTPYIARSTKLLSYLDFACPCELVPTAGTHSVQGQKLDEGDNESENWSFVGMYDYKKWEKRDPGLGHTFGFAAERLGDSIKAGDFVKVASGADILPLRAYLYLKTSSKRSAPIPETVKVVVVESSLKIDEGAAKNTTAIGTINTRTGEIKFATDRWFDLNGRYLGNKKPTIKGAYYNNGKKVIVK